MPIGQLLVGVPLCFKTVELPGFAVQPNDRLPASSARRNAQQRACYGQLCSVDDSIVVLSDVVQLDDITLGRIKHGFDFVI